VASSKKQSGLGRGLGALIPQNFDTMAFIEDGERVRQIAVSDLKPNAEQPRTVFDKAALEELAASILEHGIVQPLVVSPQGEGYIIIAGERRYRAAKLAKLKKVPALVRTSEQLEQLEIALIENVQRVDLSSLEQAVSIERLHQQFGVSYTAIAKRLGKAETTISNIVRLLQLPNSAQTALREGKITEGHARQILALKQNPTQQSELLQLIVQHGWSVRQAERFVSSVKAGYKESQSAKQHMSAETPETKLLSKQYGTNVRIHRTARGGKIELQFTSDEELRRLLAALSE